jgi:CBS domain-containing protein
MKTKDIMVVGVVTTGGDDSVTAAARLMRVQNVGMLVVGNGSKTEGVVTDRDLLVRCVAENHAPSQCKVSAHMTAPVIAVDAELDVLQTAKLLREKGIKRVAVTEDGKLAGVLSLTDIAQAMDEPLHDVLFGAGKPRKAPVSYFVGKVNHYFTNLGVGGVSLEAPLRTGDRVHVVGHTTSMSFTVDSLEVNHRKTDAAYPGDDIAIKVPSRVRPGDRVYVEAAPR